MAALQFLKRYPQTKCFKRKEKVPRPYSKLGPISRSSIMGQIPLTIIKNETSIRYVMYYIAIISA